MKFNVNQQDLQKSLNYCQGVIEKRSTLPILSNVLLKVQNKKLIVVATDLDLVYFEEISNFNAVKDGSTTTSATVLYDILRKLPSNLDVEFNLQDEKATKNMEISTLESPIDSYCEIVRSSQATSSLIEECVLGMFNRTRIKQF